MTVCIFKVETGSESLINKAKATQIYSYLISTHFFRVVNCSWCFPLESPCWVWTWPNLPRWRDKRSLQQVAQQWFWTQKTAKVRHVCSHSLCWNTFLTSHVSGSPMFPSSLRQSTVPEKRFFWPHWPQVENSFPVPRWIVLLLAAFLPWHFLSLWTPAVIFLIFSIE